MKFLSKTLFSLILIAISIQASSTCCPNTDDSKCESVTNANILLIPECKSFSENYVKNLFARGKKDVYSGKALETIGMPCGGIGCGQMYLCGDGSLADWQIFGFAVSRWVSNTFSTYGYQKMRKPVDQGFAIAIKAGDANPTVKKLNKDGFGYENIHFNGEYPIGTIGYSESSLPAKISMEVFSPFIPLDAKNSAFPATIFKLAQLHIKY